MKHVNMIKANVIFAVAGAVAPAVGPAVLARTYITAKQELDHSEWSMTIYGQDLL